jgi:hypothetical protein
LEGGSSFRTNVLSEDVASDGTVQFMEHAVSRGFNDAKGNSDEQEKEMNEWRCTCGV